MSYREDDEWIQRHKDEFFPIKLFYGETGETKDHPMSYCLSCRYPEPTVINLAEWSHKTRRLECKVTGKDQDGEDTFDW